MLRLIVLLLCVAFQLRFERRVGIAQRQPVCIVFRQRGGVLSQVGPVADLQLRHELADIRLRVFRFLIENALTVALCVLPLAVLQEQGRAAQQGRCGICRTCNGFCAENFFDPADQVLHEPKPRHVERLQVRKFLRQIVRAHVPIRRNQHLLFATFDKRQKARPLVTHPDGGEIFRFGA